MFLELYVRLITDISGEATKPPRPLTSDPQYQASMARLIGLTHAYLLGLVTGLNLIHIHARNLLVTLSKE